MAYEFGTASSYTDLLERLKDFISDSGRIIGDDPNMDELVAIDSDISSGETSQVWTIDRWTDTGEIEMVAHGPGSSGVEEIYIAINTYSSVGSDYYNWRLMGMTGFASGADLQYQPGITQGRLPRMLLWNNPIPYWFFANGRRFLVIAKVSSVYEMCYMGYALPYGLPTQFPYPLCIGGSACPDTTVAYHRYSSTNSDHRGFPNPYGGTISPGAIVQGVFDTTAWYSTLKILQGTSWIAMKSKVSSSLYNDNNIWPYVSAEYGSVGFYNIFSRYLRENIDGSYPVFPCVIMINNPTNHIMGELQGVYAVPGYGGISAEDTFTIGSDTYIAFPILPNADANDFFCMKKE